MKDPIRWGTAAKAGSALALVGASLLGCEGYNAFGPGVDVGPEVVEFVAPEIVDEGEEFEVTARAVGLVRVDSLRVLMEVGNHEESILVTPDHEGSDVVASVTFQLPSVVSDTLVFLSGYAVDAHGNVGENRGKVIRARDLTAPSVAVSLVDEPAVLGAELRLLVGATDNVALDSIGVRLIDAAGDTAFDGGEEASGSEAEVEFTFPVPEDGAPGAWVAEGYALDRAGNEGTTTLDFQMLDDLPPTVTIVEPGEGDWHPVGDSLRVRVDVADNDGVSEIVFEGVAHRGDPELGTDQVVERFEPRMVHLPDAPADTTLTRFLTQLPADSTAEEAAIIVTATDREGNVSADTVTIDLIIDEDPPKVVILQPSAGTNYQQGDSVMVRARIDDSDGVFRSGVRTVTFQGVAFRGDTALGTFEAVPRFEERSMTVDPPVTQSAEVTRFLVPTAETGTEEVAIIVTATDGWGNVGADTLMVTVVEVQQGQASAPPPLGPGIVPIGEGSPFRPTRAEGIPRGAPP